jgi:hypothetical protein
MNTQIDTLIEVTAKILDRDPMDQMQDTEATLRQFVRAIVQECQPALNPVLRDMISRGQAYDLIKAHFGVL